MNGSADQRAIEDEKFVSKCILQLNTWIGGLSANQSPQPLSLYNPRIKGSGQSPPGRELLRHFESFPSVFGGKIHTLGFVYDLHLGISSQIGKLTQALIGLTRNVLLVYTSVPNRGHPPNPESDIISSAPAGEKCSTGRILTRKYLGRQCTLSITTKHFNARPVHQDA